MTEDFSSSSPGGAGAAKRRSHEQSLPDPPAATPDRASLLLALLEGMARGEQDTLARLYDETSPLINGLLLRMLVSPQDAEEVLLDVYMKAWRKASSYSLDRGSVQSWLVVMARSVAIDRIRQRRAQPRVSDSEYDSAMDLVSAARSPETATADEERRRRIQNAMRELPAEQREVLELAFYGGFTHSELAVRLAQPLGTVKSRIRMALGRLKAFLDEGKPR